MALTPKTPNAALIQHSTEAYLAAFHQRPAVTVLVPFSLILMGASSLAFEGLSQGICLDDYWMVSGATRMDGKVEVVDSVSGVRTVFSVDAEEIDAVSCEVGIVHRVVLELRKLGHRVSGFQMVFSGAAGAGGRRTAAESLALQIQSRTVLAAILLVRELYPFTALDAGSEPPKRNSEGGLPPLKPKEKRWVFQFCCEVLDALSSADHRLPLAMALVAESGQLLEFDAQRIAWEKIDWPGGVVAVVRPGSRDSVSRERLTPLTWQAAAEIRLALGLKSLRALDRARLRASNHLLSATQMTWLQFLTEDIQRVVAANRFLRDGQLEPWGLCVDQSQSAYRKLADELLARVNLEANASMNPGSRDFYVEVDLEPGSFLGSAFLCPESVAQQELLNPVQSAQGATVGSGSNSRIASLTGAICVGRT